MTDLDVLMGFLQMPLGSSEAVFRKFGGLRGALHRGKGPEQFLYIPGRRKDRVLLVAHSDTYWDGFNDVFLNWSSGIVEENGVITNTHGGLGADDRAGCAMLWLLKDMGHSLLITDGEEKGRLGSKWLMSSNVDVAEEINNTHQFILQFDRRGSSDFKCYSVGTDDLRQYMEEVTGYTEPDLNSRTDIVELCRDIAGANISIGYWNEHKIDEYLVLWEWQNTLEICRQWLGNGGIPRFRLKNES